MMMGPLPAAVSTGLSALYKLYWASLSATMRSPSTWYIPSSPLLEWAVVPSGLLPMYRMLSRRWKTMALWWQFLLASLTWSVREMIPSGVGFQLVVLISVTFWPASLSASAVLEALLDPMTRKPPRGGCPMSNVILVDSSREVWLGVERESELCVQLIYHRAD